MIDMTFLIASIAAYNSTAVEVPDHLLEAAQLVTPLATNYRRADNECRVLGLIVYFRGAKEVGRQKI